MVQHTVHDSSVLKVALGPQDVATSPVNGIAIDTAGYTDITFICASGAITGTLDWTVEMDDNQSFTSTTAVTGAASTQFSAANDNLTTSIHVHLDPSSNSTGQARERWMRIVATPTGGSTNLAGAVAVLENWTGERPARIGALDLTPIRGGGGDIAGASV